MPSTSRVSRASDTRRSLWVSFRAVASASVTVATARNETHSDLRVSLALETRLVDGTAHYAGRPVRLGRTIGIETDDYEFAGEVVDRG